MCLFQYWDYKFRNATVDVSNATADDTKTELQYNFNAYMAVASMLPNTTFLTLNAIFAHKSVHGGCRGGGGLSGRREGCRGGGGGGRAVGEAAVGEAVAESHINGDIRNWVIPRQIHLSAITGAMKMIFGKNTIRPTSNTTLL